MTAAFFHPLDLSNISRLDVSWVYLKLGYTHILPLGLDHILFVLGLFLLSNNIRQLLSQVTAFTIAHSITLGLAMYEIVSIPSFIIEPVIALSIVFIAVENVITKKLRPWRILVVFAFGLVHGMGFAGALKELGLPKSQFLTALLTFNVGVELGQLSVIAIAFLICGLWFRRKEWYRQRIVIPASLMITAIAAYWTIERIFF